MTRFLRFTLVALIIGAMGVPIFALPCRSCGALGVCESTPNSGTRCRQFVDYCQDFITACAPVAGEDTLADTLAIASVEVVTPAGVTKTSDAPRLAAARQPLAKASTTTSVR
jgi:hypothetical protein